MSKLDNEIVGKIQSYHKDFSNNEIAKELGINRKTVAKYRNIIDNTKEETAGVLSGKEEQMWLKQKIEGLSKEDKKKLELLQHYSPKDIKEMLWYIAQTNKKEIEKVIWEPWHLKFGLIADTHIWARECDLDWIKKFYEDAKNEWVEAIVHAGDLVDWCWVYKGQKFEQTEVWYEDQLNKVIKEYPNIWVPTYFIWGNHDLSYLSWMWADICRSIDLLREDLIYLGAYEAKLKLNWITIELQHWGWWTSYSQDYKLLKYLDKIKSWDEPDIYWLGHYHQAIHSLHRGIHWYMPASFLKENLLAKRFGFPNVIGGWIIDIEKTKDWKKRVVSTFIDE